jgi:aldehyde dehydrogenase (NAD(P)+)
MRLLRESLLSLRDSGNTPAGEVRDRGNGGLAVSLFPAGTMDRILLRGVTAEAYLENGVGRRDHEEGRAPFYRRAPHDGRVVLVLGGGNIAAVPVTDVLTKLFNEGKVCLLKMNPVNSYLGPHIERAFAAAVGKGFLAVVYGGADEGGYLCAHEVIDEVHVTGSDRTFESIVWGEPGSQRTERQTRGTPLLRKPITSELGNVSPVIVVPGPYEERELKYQAGDVVGYATMNASFLCNTAKMLVTSRKWEGRVPFIRHIQDFLARTPTRRAYYPGAEERWYRFIKGQHRLRTFGGAGQGRLPWALATWIDPEDKTAPLYREECFCPVIGETSLSFTDPEDFMEEAVNFVTGRLWGTLTATLVVHPETMKSRSLAAAVERAIERLRYGAVAVNAFPGMIYALGGPPWGAWQGSMPQDIQSGHGWVHNTSMLEGVEKVVYRHPLTAYPRPPFFPNNRNYRVMMRRLTFLEERGEWGRLPGVLSSALLGA